MKRLKWLMVTVWLVVLVQLSASAQLLSVTGNYRVTEVDKEKYRVGVALPEASPDKTQNFVYLDLDTDIYRHLVRDGWHKKEKLRFDQFLDSIQKGEILRIHGGRRWDSGITAKSIVIAADSDDDEFTPEDD